MKALIIVILVVIIVSFYVSPDWTKEKIDGVGAQAVHTGKYILNETQGNKSSMIPIMGNESNTSTVLV